MFDKEQNSEQLDKMMDSITDKQKVLFDNNEDTNNIQLEEEIYQRTDKPN